MLPKNDWGGSQSKMLIDAARGCQRVDNYGCATRGKLTTCLHFLLFGRTRV
jgi:hypothetical protein